MSLFTRRQHDFLGVLARMLTWHDDAVACKWVRPVHLQIVAIKATLVRKGLATEKELGQAVKEAEAGRSIDEALNPELQAAYKELNRLIAESETLKKKRKRQKRKSDPPRASR